MFRGLTTFAVAATLGVFAGGELYAQSEPQSMTGTSAQSSARPQAEQGRPGAAARERLLEARESLAEAAKMPEATQLQGQARTGVSQAITNFNALLTAEANWYDQYKLVMQNLYDVLGSPTAGESAAGTSGSASTGTTGSATAGSSEEVPSALRSKLAEFRQKLMAFGREAGAPDVNGGVTGPGTSGTSGASTAGTSGTGTSGTSGTSTSGTSTSGTSGTSGTSTSGTSGTAGTSSTSSSPQTSSAPQSSSAAEAETLEQHIDAIHDIIQQALTGAGGASATGTSASGSTSGTGSAAGSGSTAGTAGSTSSVPGVVTIDREKLDRIQSHLQRMREIARAKGIK